MIRFDKEMKDANTEVKAIQNCITGKKDANEDEPDGVKIGDVHGLENWEWVEILGSGFFCEEIIWIYSGCLGVMTFVIPRTMLDFLVQEIEERGEEQDVDQREEND